MAQETYLSCSSPDAASKAMFLLFQDVDFLDSNDNVLSPLPTIWEDTITFETSCVSKTNLPTGWARYSHFRGHAYFVHHALRLITSDNVEDPELLQTVLRIRKMFLKECEEAGLLQKMPDDWQLVIDCSEVLPWFVSHKERRIICVDPSRDTDIRRERDRMAYWFELSEFPMHLTETPYGADEDFMTALQDGFGSDIPTDETDCKATSIDAEAEHILQIYARFKDAAVKDSGALPALIYFMARMIIEIEIGRLEYSGVQHSDSPRSAQFWKDRFGEDGDDEDFILTALEDLHFPIDEDADTID
ncbi:hypothetical protein OBBRIDRAFT_121303 [Obba rivulosa]|uniref:Uncharacterized protein n=1 Tax=Obba rivulosa TaxID=1052685 RepID=A0A8E2DRG7_9APHY|nr:hypothetical protein OBBRIDRAFT_121303 [Obba rivulosa]